MSLYVLIIVFIIVILFTYMKGKSNNRKEEMSKPEFHYENENASSIKILTSEIRSALNVGFYNTALALTLTLPDICSQIEYNSVQSNKLYYIKWINDHKEADMFDFVLPGFEKQTFAGNMCYSLRCAVLHSGNDDVNNQKLNVTVNMFELTKPGDSSYYHGYRYIEKTQDDGSTQTITIIGIDYLCECICDMVDNFYDNWIDKSDFENHMISLNR